MKVAVIGSRGWSDRAKLYRDLDKARAAWGDFTVVSGGARGADFEAAAWARDRGLAVEVFYPNYGLYGRAAPLERNHTIIEQCDKVIAFWDGESRGTAYTLKLAREAGKKSYIRLPAEPIIPHGGAPPLVPTGMLSNIHGPLPFLEEG